MNDKEKKLLEMIDTPRDDFAERYEYIKDRLVVREPKQTKKVFGWKKLTAIAASFVLIVAAVVTSVLLLNQEEPRYLMTDINEELSDKTAFETTLQDIELNILNLSAQTVASYTLYEAKETKANVGGEVEFNGTSNNDFYRATVEIYSKSVEFNTQNYIGYTNTQEYNDRTYYYINNGEEGPFKKISCYYTGDDFSIVVDYQGIAGDVWGLLDVILQTDTES